MNNNEIIRDVTYNENVMNNDPFIRDFVTLNKSVMNYLPRCSYHLLYLTQVTSIARFIKTTSLMYIINDPPNFSFHLTLFYIIKFPKKSFRKIWGSGVDSNVHSANKFPMNMFFLTPPILDRKHRGSIYDLMWVNTDWLIQKGY